MTETEYAHFVHHERQAARTHLERELAAWRRLYWTPAEDPILREKRMARYRHQLAVEAYWGAAVLRRPMYGGICGA